MKERVAKKDLKTILNSKGLYKGYKEYMPRFTLLQMLEFLCERYESLVFEWKEGAWTIHTDSDTTYGKELSDALWSLVEDYIKN